MARGKSVECLTPRACNLSVVDYLISTPGFSTGAAVSSTCQGCLLLARTRRANATTNVG